MDFWIKSTIELISWQNINIVIIALLPIIIWMVIFYFKHPEKKSYVILAFVAGMLSIAPIKLYEKYWDSAFLWLQNIDIFKSLESLTSIQTLPAFLSFMVISITVSLFIFVFAAFLIFLLEVIFGHERPQHYFYKIKKIIETPFLFVSVGIIIGLVAYFLWFSVDRIVWFFVVVAMLEEYTKHLVLRFSSEKKIQCINDAIEFSVLVALGFAFVENIFYLQKIIDNQIALQSLILIIALRSTLSVGAHVCFSAIFAYFYGVAKFNDNMHKPYVYHNFPGKIMNFIHQFLHCKRTILIREKVMLEGMLLAIFLHVIFNLLLEFQQIGLSMGLIFGLLIYVWHLFSKYPWRPHFHQKETQTTINTFSHPINGFMMKTPLKN